MIVVDTNILVHFLTRTEYSNLADELWQKDQEWIAPVLILSEFRNVLVSMCRIKGMDITLAGKALDKAERVFKNRLFLPDGNSVIHLAKTLNLSAYDAEYVWLAREKNLILVTEDKAVLKNVPGIAVSLEMILKS